MSKHKTKKTKKSPSKTSKIHFQSSEKNLTSQAGLIPVVKFLEKLGFKELFDEHVSHQRAENAQYRLADGVFMILTGFIGGAFSLTKLRFGQIVYYVALLVFGLYHMKPH